MEMMSSFSKVVFISPGGRFQGGGLGTMTREMEAGLRVRGKTAIVLNTRSEGTVLKSLYETPFAISAFILQMLMYKRCVVHVQLTQRLSIVREGMFVLLAVLFQRRAILHHHGADFPDSISRAHPILKWLAGIVCRAADVNIVLGQRWKLVLHEYLGVDQTKVIIVNNSIRTSSNADRIVHKPLGKPVKLLLLANLTPRKGVKEALLALQALRAAGVDAVLSLAGGGQIERYSQVAKELTVAEFCTFHGWIDHPSTVKLLSNSDIMIVPSHSEGFPMSIIEAFAANLPVITTPVGSIPELVTDGIECLFVPVGDPVALKSAVQKIISDSELSRRIAQNAYLKFQQALNHDYMMDKLMLIWNGPSV